MSIRFLQRNLVARHNQLLRVKSNGQPLERSQVTHPSRLLRREGSYDLTPQLSDSSLGFSLLCASAFPFSIFPFLFSILCSLSVSALSYSSSSLLPSSSANASN